MQRVVQMESHQVIVDAVTRLSGEHASTNVNPLSMSPMRQTDSYQEQSTILQTDSGNQSVGASSGMSVPPSPVRPSHTPIPSSPNVGAVSQSMSPTPTQRQYLTPQKENLSTFVVPTLEYNSVDLLGLQNLTAPAGSLEEQRHYVPQQVRSTHHPQDVNNPALGSEDDDERTEPSSTVTGNTGENPAGYTRTDPVASSTFGRLIQNTRVSGNFRLCFRLEAELSTVSAPYTFL